MKKWDKRQIRTFFCVIIFGFVMIMIAEALGQLPIVSSVMLGTGTVLFVNMMPSNTGIGIGGRGSEFKRKLR